jgi:hypothetical protein
VNIDFIPIGTALVRLALACGVLLCVVPAAAAQNPPSGGGLAVVKYPPSIGGLWDGPYDLQGTSIREISSSEYYEIVHAALIPPHSTTLSHPDLGCVLFWGRRYGAYNGPAKTYVWNPRFPQMVKPLVITGVDESADPFCSGHTWMPNGDLYIAGGTNHSVPQTPTATGHEHVFRLSYASGNGVWTNSVSGGMTPMADRRWYPSVLQLADQRTIIHGTAGTWGGPVIPTRTRDVVLFSDPLITAPANQLNLMRDIGILPPSPPTCSPNEIQARLGPYARVFALRNGLAFDAGPDGDSTYWDAANHYGTVGQTFSPPHQNCTPIPDRWVKGGVNPEMHAPAHLDGGAVHLITRLQPGETDPLFHGFAETIYQLGGNTHYEPEEACCGCSAGSPIHDDGTAIVEKIRNPTPDLALDFGTPPLSWDDSPPDLSAPRADITAVVLLDGSILVLGGERMDPVGCDGNCFCIAVNTPELYKPPEVFGAGASSAWIDMNPHVFAHRYHSSALLLPTGDVVLAGGQFGSGDVNPSDKIVEVFKPPYLYSGPRPIIDTTSLYASIGADQTVSYLELGEAVFQFDVALGDLEAPIARVAVLRPGSVTHSFDFNQRYVELEIAGTGGPPIDGVVTLFVRRPPEIEYTPPGWYLITVVDTAGRPADAKWIRFSP